MRGEIGRSDRHGLEQQSDRRRTIAGLRESRGPITQRGEGATGVLLRGLRAREAAVRLDVTLLSDELPIRDLRVLGTSTGEELCGRIAREAVAAVGRLLRDTAGRERGGELRGALVAH